LYSPRITPINSGFALNLVASAFKAVLYARELLTVSLKATTSSFAWHSLIDSTEGGKAAPFGTPQNSTGT
jgi:hypothetical protein